MIHHLEGTLTTKDPARAVVEVHGVGYELLIPLSTYDRLPEAGKPCRVLCHLQIREDAHVLFGFATETERTMFRMLLEVNGIGPKLAVTILSGLSVRDIKTAIAEGDSKRLSGISGIGKKTAERILVELRDKLSAGEALEAIAGEHAAPAQRHLRDAVLALISLGYKQADAQKKIQAAAAKLPRDASVEELIRSAVAG
ncbi:MAG: Holliday junction branch migration protein RuvA [Verrucomicrobia bacterium]|nr:Holliday junction branch migration protein RuvA [Kiritimatiellia bacterium]MCP5487127.1 Holliday junction branch migration protein RuvA [Verrucomicrobiota bacterium]